MKKNILSFIIGAILFSSITLVSAYSIFSSNVGFLPTDETWEVDNVQDAIDNLYNIIVKKMTSGFRKYLLINNDTISLDDLFSSINFCSDSHLIMFYLIFLILKLFLIILKQ